MKKSLIYFVAVIMVTIFSISCKQASKDVLEKSTVKIIGNELIEKISKSSIREISLSKLSTKAQQFALQNFDNAGAKKLLQLTSDQPIFLKVFNSNPEYLKTYKVFENTEFSTEIAQLRKIHQTFNNDKYLLKSVEDGVEVSEKTSGKYLGKFERNKISARPGKGGKDLNPILNHKDLIPNTTYNLDSNGLTPNITFTTDKSSRVCQLYCPKVSKNAIGRSEIEQGLAKKYKNGVLKRDELGNIIIGKAGNPKYSDDGGHLLANILGGPSEQINVLPMARTLNRTDFKKMELNIVKELESGKSVTDFKVSPKYSDKGGRPNKIFISYCVDGKLYTHKFINY